MKEMQTTIEPGFYQMNFGGASLRECWRLSRTLRSFLLALYFKAINRASSTCIWLPPYQGTRYCDFAELGSRTRENIGPEIEKAALLGFENGKCLIAENVYNSSGYIEGGNYGAIHKDKKRFIKILYAYSRHDEAANVSVGTSSLSYMIGFCDAVSRYLVYVHNLSIYFDGCGNARGIRLRTTDLGRIAGRAEKELQQYAQPVQSFRDTVDFDEFNRPLENQAWLHRIKRGLYVRVPQI